MLMVLFAGSLRVKAEVSGVSLTGHEKTWSVECPYRSKTIQKTSSTEWIRMKMVNPG